MSSVQENKVISLKSPRKKWLAEQKMQRNHWAPISGSIEPTDATPLDAAKRELDEETTLAEPNLVLLRRGKCYTFTDMTINREWTIYPFAFRLVPPVGSAAEDLIQIDWEHTSWAWFDPAAVTDEPAAGFGGVPRLEQSLHACWPQGDLVSAEAAAVLDGGLEALRTDHESGARALAGKALQTFADVLALLEPPPPPPTSNTIASGNAGTPSSREGWRAARVTAWHLWKNGRPSMNAAILSVLVDALEAAEAAAFGHKVADTALRVDAVAKSLENLKVRRRAIADDLSEAFVRYVEDTLGPRAKDDPRANSIRLLTLSSSGTILAALRKLAVSSSSLSIDLRILESRPLFEGASMAVELASQLSSGDTNGLGAKVNITVYPDCAAAIAARDLDLLLIGADRIAGDSGSVNNKIGTLPAVLCARHAAPRTAKIVVLSEHEKVAFPGKEADHATEDNDAAEVTRAWGLSARRGLEKLGQNDSKLAGASKELKSDTVGIEVKNVYFEWLPAELIDSYISEGGQRTVDDIRRRSEHMASQVSRFFDSL